MALINCRIEQFGMNMHQAAGVCGSYAASQASAAFLRRGESLDESTNDDDTHSPTRQASNALATRSKGRPKKVAMKWSQKRISWIPSCLKEQQWTGQRVS